MAERAIFFDLDGTLYRSPLIAEKFAEAAYHTYAQVMQCPLEEARNIVEQRRELLSREKGHQVPYTLTLLSFGVPMETWHAVNIAHFNAGDYLEVNNDLRDCLAQLKKKYRLAVITNNNKVQCERILEAVGIRSMFDNLFTYNTFKLLKPDPEFFKKASATMKINIENCIMVGDRYNVDLDPARHLGMSVYEVKGPDDICRFARDLCSKEDL